MYKIMQNKTYPKTLKYPHSTIVDRKWNGYIPRLAPTLEIPLPDLDLRDGRHAPAERR